MVRGGIPQGCSLSGAPFATASFPLIQMLASAAGAGRVFCCTDDGGERVLLEDTQLLPQLHRVFEAFATAAGLKLKVAKCAAVPLGARSLTEQERLALYRTVLRQTVPGCPACRCSPWPATSAMRSAQALTSL